MGSGLQAWQDCWNKQTLGFLGEWDALWALVLQRFQLFLFSSQAAATSIFLRNSWLINRGPYSGPFCLLEGKEPDRRLCCMGNVASTKVIRIRTSHGGFGAWGGGRGGGAEISPKYSLKVFRAYLDSLPPPQAPMKKGTPCINYSTQGFVGVKETTPPFGGVPILVNGRK